MRLRRLSLVFLGVFPLLSACGGQAADVERGGREPVPTAAAPVTAAPVSNAPSETAAAPQIIFLGDSLTAGLGLETDQSFPALIQARLAREDYPYRVINAGVSGDTSAGGLRRLEWAMSEGDPKILVVALGGNDGLRGLPAEALEKNLAAIIEQGQQRKLTVILAGMEAPPNFGADYTTRFRQVYSNLAARYNVPLIPFLLEGVAGNPAFNQSDGIHPNPRGAELVADLVWRTLEPALARAGRTTAR